MNWFIRKIYPSGLKTSIRLKLAIVITVLIGVISTVIYIVIPEKIEEQSMKIISARAHTIVEMSAFSISSALYFDDRATIDEAIASAMQNRDLQYLVVEDSNGTVVSEYNQKYAETMNYHESNGNHISPDGTLFREFTPIILHEKEIGRLYIGLSLLPLQTEIQSNKASISMLSGLIFVVGMLFVFGISTVITRPLNNLVETVEHITKGDLTRRVTVSTHDEVAELGKAFNAMVNNIEQQTNMLKSEIDQRKKGEEKIAQQAALLDVTRDAIIVRDLDECIIFWNSGAAHLYGWQSEEVLGKSAAELFFKETPSKFDEAKKVLLEKGEWQGECTHLTKDGREIAVNSHWTLVKDQAGKPKSILVINTDITEQKRLQAQFLRSQRMESVGTLAGGIAHDLNNILAPILLSVEILRNKVVDGSALKMLDVLESSAKRGAGIIKQILTFARGTQGEKTLLQPKYLVSEIEKMISDTFPRSIQITTKSVKHPWIIQGDPTQLYQVLMNLCVNARDAMPNGGVLMIETDNIVLDEHMTGIHLDAKPGSYVVISVSDAGMGIPASVIDKIFEPFFTTKEIGKGTGLGLSTVIGIVKSHSGFVTVYSEINKGTRFKVYLPATDTKESEGAMDDKVELPKGKGELVLVVDDEDAIRDIQKRTLEAHGYSVLTARDGTEAIVKYSSNQEMIEVVVTDMMMPYMDGVATIRAIRRLNPAVKFIGMSGLLEGTDYNKVVGGDVIFLQKPYTTEKFLTTLNEVINQA